MTHRRTHNKLEHSQEIEEETRRANATPDADNDTYRSDVVSTDVAQYMVSLPLIDTEYILKCRH